jgi:hypothetical protein
MPVPYRVSRRSWLALAASGTGLAALAVLWRRRDAAEASPPADPQAPFVDHDGWIVTLDDRRALVSRDRR